MILWITRGPLKIKVIQAGKDEKVALRRWEGTTYVFTHNELGILMQLRIAQFSLVWCAIEAYSGLKSNRSLLRVT